ncbi:hypothetical protein [Microbulbifer hainanensis]|uniref:hypothetical protein n=1 Tax=Microbulbifer hainanensis TaxID=2735675 RepID=UPI001866C67B|nr:hypothetical protein [Microbulbifer hainanensis]
MKFFTQERLNLLIAICAVLISGASFYATYLQANAAEKQVHAMTLPLVNFENSNLDSGNRSPQITFSLKNSGIGPALVQAFEIEYKGETYRDINSLLSTCCNYDKYRETLRAATNNFSEVGGHMGEIDGAMITSNVVNSIIPGQSSLDFMTLPYGNTSRELWETINRERIRFSVKTCYCSLLGECYWSGSGGVPAETKSCPRDT